MCPPDEQLVMPRLRFVFAFLVALTALSVLVTSTLAETLFMAGDSTASACGPEQYPRTGWGQGDVLLIQFGHNDQKVNSPVRYAPADTAFKEAS
jgi:lysophospholipase L1-like esterase